MIYLDDQLRELCNAIVLQAVTDCRLGRMTPEDLHTFLRSRWGILLLRGVTDADAVLEHLGHPRAPGRVRRVELKSRRRDL